MIFKGIIRWLIGFLLIFAVLLTFLFLTQPGLRLTVSIAKYLIPGKLTYQHIQGALIGPIEVKGLHYQNKQDTIKINSLSFNYEPLDLLTGTLYIKNLHVKHAYIKTKTADNTKKTSFSLPFDIEVKKSTLQDITIDNKTPIYIKIAHFSGNLSEDVSTIQLNAELLKPYPIKIKARVNGAPNQYTFRLQTWAKNLNAILIGEGNLEQIHFTTHESHILNGSLNANATIHFKKPLSWNIKLHAKNLDLGIINPSWPSPLTINLDSQGKLVENNPQLSINADIQTPSITGTIKANNEHGLKASWNLVVAQVSKFIPNASGQIKTQGNATGTLKQPILDGKLQATRFTYKNIHADEINATARIDTSQQSSSEINLQGKNVSINNIVITAMTATGKGTLGQHHLQIKLNSANTLYTLQLQGGYIQNVWQGELQTFNINGYPWGQWSLAQAAKLNLSTQQVTFSNFCLKGKQNGELCLQGFWHQNKPWQLQAKGTNIPPDIINALLNTRLKIQSKGQLNALIKGQGKHFSQGEINFKLSPGQFVFDAFGKPHTRRLLSGNIHITILKSGLRSQFNLQLDNKDNIKMDLYFPQFNTALFSSKQTMSGRLNINLNSLRWLTSIIPGVELPAGEFYTQMNIGGSLAKPQLSGKTSFKNTQINIPALGLQLKQTQFKIQADNEILHYTISATSDGGPVTISGKTNFGEKDFPTTLIINMDNALIYNTNEYKIYATAPLLTADIKGKDLIITGTVNIPKATLQPKQFENLKTLPQNEIEFIGQPPTPFQRAWNIKSNVFVTLGKDVTINTKGVQGNLTGNLLVTNNAQEQMIATGSIYLNNGKFTAYGTNLTFSKDSAAIFRNSPLGNPNLDIKASKIIKASSNGFTQASQIGNITVGLHITGTLKHPLVKLFSMPPTLSQADVLSYLVLGYASTSGKASDVGLLLRAVNAFNLTSGKGGEGLVSELQQGLGLSELGIETQSTLDALGQPLNEKQTSFVVGKQISPRVYLRYSLGLNNVPGLEAGSMVELRFSLSRHWMIQTNAGTADTGIDIFYMIDK